MSDLTELQEKIDALHEAINRLQGESLAQGLALQAMAKTHPLPAQTTATFRRALEHSLEHEDDDPFPLAYREAFLIEANGFLEALKRDAPASE
jgi:hypothetical protein